MNGSGENVDSAKKVNDTTDAQTTGIVQPTYKKLPDADSNWNANQKPGNMSKQNGTDTDIDDGAQEKMLKDETKVTTVTPAKNSIEQVKFGSSNGETKVDIEVSKPMLTGMGKEELMKYANDPFWVRIRWLLFISFWSLWIALLAGAITIIVLAPKCTPPEEKKIWQKKAIIDLDFNDADPKNFQGLAKLLKGIADINGKLISLPPIYSSNDDNVIAAVNFTELNAQYGTMSDFKTFINETKSLEQFVILKLNPHITSQEHTWFNKSINKEEKYENYYIWINSSDPNNDESFKLISEEKELYTWYFNEQRKQYYLGSLDNSKPCLNFRESDVVEEMKNVMAHWLNLGTLGFIVDKPQYLIKGLKQNESDDTKREENINLIKELHKIVLNKTDGNGLLAPKDPIGNDLIHWYNKPDVLSLVYTNRIVDQVHGVKDIMNLTEFGNKINKFLKEDSKWPSWDLKRHANRLTSEEADNIMLFTMLLPGTPVFRYQDIMKNNTKDTFKQLSELRKDHTFQHGNFSISLLQNGTTIAYTRTISGKPGYLVAYYSGNETADVDFSSIEFVPQQLEVVANSYDYKNTESGKNKKMISSKAVLLQPKNTLAMKFVPKTE